MINKNYENLVSPKMQDLSRIGSEIRNTFMLGQSLLKTQPSLIDLSLGNPDLEPPTIVKEKLKELLMRDDLGEHRYMDGAGLLNVREYLAKELSHSEEIEITSEQVFLTVGAAGALQICMRAFLSPGDEVIIFNPYFPEYLSYSHHLSATPVIIESDEKHEPILEDLSKKLSDKTKLVIMNSPNNPSGVCYSNTRVKKIFEILLKFSESTGNIIPVLSDEPYMRLLYKPRSESTLKLYPYTFLIRSLSKDLGLAGERIGYFAWSIKAFPEAINLMNVFRNAARVSGFVSAPRIMQRLIPYIYNAKVDIDIYKQRVDLFLKSIENSGIECVVPHAGFFVFPKIKNNWTDIKFCEELARNGVLCVPGSAFGKPGFMRISLTRNLDEIKKAGKIISNVYNRLTNP